MLKAASTELENDIFFNILNRAGSNGYQVCRGQSHPKTSHTALGAV
jgi:hypothetical protein